MKAPVVTFSVIIATKNRAEELRTISLPSLAKQDNRDFEIIAWDASEDDRSEQVVEAFAAAHPDLSIFYFKAPRAGSCAQRNDAVKVARGEIVFFIDDDSEVSPDGIAALRDTFEGQAALSGTCLPLDYFLFRASVGKSGSKTEQLRAFLLAIYGNVFGPVFGGSGVFKASLPGHPNRVSYLSGCDMAFRKGVFQHHSFNERLQKYGGYALWEDIEFSQRLHREGHILCVTEYGFVVHRAASGQRAGDLFNKGKLQGYNACVVWRKSIFPFSPWSVISFVWARIGFLGVVLLQCFLRPWQKERWKRTAGYLTGLWVFTLEEIRGYTEP